jgi:hypothetical protein
VDSEQRTNILAGVKEAAEIGLIPCEKSEKHTAGAKAQRLFCCICGTTEVVPCYKTGQLSRFSAACKARVDFAVFAARLKSYPETKAGFSISAWC